ncbi:hypothetical protein K466DRAFT_602504 [Polyporus arcularius HHB13444]|uniref:RanBP2-type domain-containing protein n=1 Tax=Polyporus arcularius HHB13444 TaxID=1314778 RepID=A0A5C3P2I3_9APHY|nr:hypothetical protein K466DRAFT_602504 [Polyporus arcularius HHB13444]
MDAYPPSLAATLRPSNAPNHSRGGRLRPDSPSPPTRENLAAIFSPVVRLANLRNTPKDLLWNLFAHACSQINLPPPSPLFIHPDAASSVSGLCAVFPSAQDARASLSLSCDIFVVTPVSDHDLALLRRPGADHPERDMQQPRRANTLPPASSSDMAAFTVRPPLQLRGLGQPPNGDLVGHGPPPFTLSSNPPNPKTSFRAGDWMCSAPACSAHNFQRNTTCIACGRPRAGIPLPPPVDTTHAPGALANPSPRFACRFNATQSAPHTPIATTPFSPSGPAPSAPPYPFHAASSALAAAQAQIPSKAPPPQYPPLTPSGRALSVGGRVRNISRDPLAPCVMYWPDNEPLPEPCQIRPMDSTLMTFPPIINTGNKGVAEKQPGDWVCGKCNYHNWRRRKVCQTCFPYAEGNGDSISATVQAERIALLANVLTTQFNALDLNGVPSQSPAHGPHRDLPPPTSAPPYPTRFFDGPGPVSRRSSVANSLQSSPLLTPLTIPEQTSPIYQTSGGRPHPANLYSPFPARLNGGPISASPHSSTLLPSFLQDIVHSPSQSPSPTSSSSADFSFDGSSEDAHYVLTPSTSTSVSLSAPLTPSSRSGPEMRKVSSNSSFTSLGRSTAPLSIWKLDGEESRTLSSATSSARTSPTTAFAQTALQNGDGAGTGADVELLSGTTPKCSTGFWQARYNNN